MEGRKPPRFTGTGSRSPASPESGSGFRHRVRKGKAVRDEEAGPLGLGHIGSWDEERRSTLERANSYLNALLAEYAWAIEHADDEETRRQLQTEEAQRAAELAGLVHLRPSEWERIVEDCPAVLAALRAKRTA